MSHEQMLRRAQPGIGPIVNFSGVWKNELGSKAVLEQDNMRLSGTYESAVSADGHKTTGELRGYVNGDLISFVVHWREFQAITAWVGQLLPGSSTALKTLWQMTSQVAPGEEWASINAGSDLFKRQP
ncbi:avidin/streptavidin family protein [Chitinimonas lacunae]|uniref:Avidin/streptavidin family protein n=1 Tax=Chitinimonas lacunae TaxID=1963018 RepID=A0ABV8MLM6_9NEIS